MITIKKASLAFGEQTLFKDLNLSITSQDRIGLFGLNGAGKSTLLKAIAGMIKLDQGSITIEKSATIAYMPQEVVLQSERSILDEMLSADTAFWKTKEYYEKAAHDLEQDPENEILQNNYAQASTAYYENNPGLKKSEALKILAGLGFDTATTEKSVNTLSTGWKMRIVLGQLLFKKASFYLFDEPTNHLDIVAQTWFLRFLKNSNFGFLIVCHEKKFLNQLCTKICALEYGIPTIYQGNYDAYVHQRDERYKTIEAQYIVQKKEIEQMEATINRFRASATKASLAQSMMKKLEKIERIVLPPTPPKASFTFPFIEKSSRIVLKVDNFSYAYGQKQIFSNCSFILERGQKIAIVAPNGGGKTTLIRLIQGMLTPQSGAATWGENVTKAFFDQDQVATLSLQQTVLENALEKAKNQTTQGVRTLLGNFLFQGSDVAKKASVLSGGERNRLGMVRVLLEQANTLILDEPTNHLDIPSKDILANALQRFEGTILFVSHDQDFINHIATHILELLPNKASLFAGNYDAYLFQKSATVTESTTKEESLQQPAEKTQPSTAKAKSNEQKSREYEKAIEKVEKAITTIQESFLDLEYGTDDFNTALKELAALEKKQATLTREWEALINTVYE